jgi:hypothetical protein
MEKEKDMLLTEKFRTGSSALILALIVLLAVSAFAERPWQTETGKDRVADQLADFKRTAYKLSHEADVLNLQTPDRQVSWESHSKRLGVLKDHVNEILGCAAGQRGRHLPACGKP